MVSILAALNSFSLCVRAYVSLSIVHHYLLRLSINTEYDNLLDTVLCEYFLIVYFSLKSDGRKGPNSLKNCYLNVKNRQKLHNISKKNVKNCLENMTI